MAAPSYTEDLTDIDLAQSTTNWLQINFAGGGGGALGTGADFAMQGTLCVDRQVTNNERGAMYDNTTGISLGANDHVFQWGFVATPGITDNLATRGAYCICGTGTGDLVQFHVEGNDTYGAQGRVGKCYTFRYVNTANTGSIPYRTLTGSPGATSPRYFGFGIKTTAAAKGANVGVDAIRYGTGAYLTAGELISAGDASDNPCTFAGFQGQNDNISNRWGILTSIGGSNYELQGRFVVGQNNSQTATLARFSDSDKNISLVDTVHSQTDFTQFIFDHASTRAEWTNINVTALGTNNPGRFVVNSANPTVIVTGGTFTDFGITTMRSNTDFIGTTFRGSDQITQNSGTLDGCLIDSTIATAAILSNNPSEVKNCEFISDGSSHAVRCDTTGTYNWTGNTDSGYTGTRGTNSTPNSGSTNAAFYNNSGGLITLNVGGGGQSPSVRNGAGATTTVNATVTLNVQVNDETDTGMEDVFVSIRDASDGSLISEGRTDATGLYSDGSYSYGADTNVIIRIRRSSPGYKRYLPENPTGTITANGLTASQTMTPDPNIALTPATDFRIVRHGLVSNDVSGATITANVKVPESTSGKRKVVAMFGFRGGASQTISGTPTFNGNNMTLYATETTQTDERAWGYYYDVPDTLAAGEYTMSVTFSSAVPERAILFAMYNKAATGAPNATATDDGAAVTGDPTFTLVPTNTNNVEVAFVLTDDLTSPAGAGTGSDVRAERGDEFVGGAWQGIVMSNKQTTAASHTVIADISATSKQYAGVAASISEG